MKIKIIFSQYHKKEKKTKKQNENANRNHGHQTSNQTHKLKITTKIN